MRLISELTIERFRSLKSIHLDSFGDFTVLAGLNNSGKSNVLRALNAFFNDVTDQGHPVVVDNDYFHGGARLKQKRQIRVAVKFNLPDQFRFRRGLEDTEKLLGGKSFSITKEWVRNEPVPRYYLQGSNSPLDPTDRQKIIQFLSLISFRYIPNRVVPVDLIKQEHQALRKVLVRRLGSRVAGGKEAFESIAKTSNRLIGSLARDFKSIVPEIEAVRLSTPTSWAEMIFAFGYRLRESGTEIDDVAQGSGIQSLLMFETLHLIDRDYFQEFGWRQASIWAVEEPESSLHSSLEAHTALLLTRMVHEPGNRLQILSSTHSDLMMQYADEGYLVEKGSEGSSLVRLNPVELIRRSAEVGISRWVHPLLYNHLIPLILVEGEYDSSFITKGFELLGIKFDGHLSYVGQLLKDTGASGGVEELKRYIREHRNLIKLRSATAPVIVVLDWDSAAKKSQFENLVDSHDPYRVVVWEESEANPCLARSFKGIERYYSDRLIGLAEREGANIARNRKGIAMVHPSDYNDVKQKLAKCIEDHGLIKEDLQYAEKFLWRLAETAKRPDAVANVV